MNCLEFKRLALSDPSNDDESFVLHSKQCADCLKYVAQVRQMDADLASSLSVQMPSALAARLKLAHAMGGTNQNNGSASRRYLSRYAIAASVAALLLAGGFFVSQQMMPGAGEIRTDYQKLLTAVVEHMDEQPMTPVWARAEANQTVKTLLASYDDSVRLNNLDNLQFGRICPMGNYRGLHATLESANGQTTFVYIKGEPIGDLLNTAYKGYITRIKPVKGGNLVIISNTQRAVDQADADLERAMVWDI
jgi:hypothetical protein